MNNPAMREFVSANTTLTLATANPDGSPQTCDVFYAHDDNLVFYFLSDPKTRHIQNLERDPRTSATIHGTARGYQELRGVQMVGEARRASEMSQRARGFALYIAKYAFVGKWLPSVDVLGQAHKLLGVVELYQLTPRWVRWIDNTKEFGFKEEWTRDA